jgi:hypothetical protein
MSKAVSAKDLVPEAYDEGSEEENREDVTDDFDYDPFNLAASNYHTVLITKKTHLEQKLVELAVRGAHHIMKRYEHSVLFSCFSTLTTAPPPPSAPLPPDPLLLYSPAPLLLCSSAPSLCPSTGC